MVRVVVGRIFIIVGVWFENGFWSVFASDFGLFSPHWSIACDTVVVCFAVKAGRKAGYKKLNRNGLRL